MNTPAKKAEPTKSTSLSDLVKKDDDKDNKSSSASPSPSPSSEKSLASQSSDKKTDNKEEKKLDEGKVTDSSFNNEETDKRDVPAGPDNDKENVVIPVAPDNDGKNKDEDVVMSRQVVSTVPNKTPAELASESPAETNARYGIDQTITDEDADNPNVQVYRDTHVNQVPSGTHLHPDIAKDLLNRGISEQTTDNAQVKRNITDSYVFAPDAETNDKF